MRPAARLGILVGVFCGLWPALAEASFEVKLTFNDEGSAYSSYYDQITAGMQAAGDAWGSHIVSSGALRVQVNFLPASGNTVMSAKSDYSTRVGTEYGYRIYQLGALTAITNPLAIPSGIPFDATLNIYTNYLVNTLWFDPDPTARAAAVPSNKIDAESVFIHEMGHMLFMSGWRDRTTGELSGDYMSTFDRHIVMIDGDPYFTGEQASTLYGGWVPLAYGNMMHVGGKSKSGQDSGIVDVMMPGIPRGQRLFISDLDLAMAADAGVRLYGSNDPDPPPPVVTPEPASLALLGIGLAVVGVQARRRTTRRAA